MLFKDEREDNMLNDMENTSQSQKILKAAFHCISVKGYANVSMRDVANESGVVLSQLYYYYKNKEGLFAEVIKTLVEKYLYEIEEELKKGCNSKDKVCNLINYFKKILTEQPEPFKLLFEVTNMALWSSPFKELLQNMYTGMSGLIDKHILSNNYDEKSTEGLSKVILGTFIGTAIQVLISPEDDSKNSLDEIQNIFEWKNLYDGRLLES